MPLTIGWMLLRTLALVLVLVLVRCGLEWKAWARGQVPGQV